ncbi:MAG: MurR/RpiR family transcriptional regulator [Clostridium sp.]|nr:MurR/RpiR family transcriptional regulator [Clostridium sp.]
MKLDMLINKYYSQLNDNDLYIWNYISKNRIECERMTIDQLAYKCNVSRTTILRFAQKLSLKGYGELKVYLKLDNEKATENTNNLSFICNSYYDVIKRIREKDCTEICKRIDKAKRLYVYGVGMVQSSIRKELKRTFLSGNKIFYDVGNYIEAKNVTRIAGEDDLCILISVSGENEGILEIAKELKMKNVTILSITRLKENSLARISDLNLYITTAIIDDISSNIEYESVTAYFILIEILFMKYMEYKDEQKA